MITEQTPSAEEDSCGAAERSRYCAEINVCVLGDQNQKQWCYELIMHDFVMHDDLLFLSFDFFDTFYRNVTSTINKAE